MPGLNTSSGNCPKDANSFREEADERARLRERGGNVICILFVYLKEKENRCE